MIYRWDAAARRISTVSDSPLDPVNLVFDKPGTLMVISYAGKGTIYSFKPGAPMGNIQLLKAEPSTERPGLIPVLPVAHWRLENDMVDAVPVRKPYQFVSPDGTMFIPAGEDFVSGRLYYGSKLTDELRAFGLTPVASGQPFYLTNDSDEKTYVGDVGLDGTVTNL